jgi:hypothetical protein
MRALIILLIIVVLSSCDTRQDPFKYYNVAPKFTVSSELNDWSNDTQYKSSIVDSLKLGSSYKIAYHYSDEYLIYYSNTPLNGTLMLFSLDTVINGTNALADSVGVFEYKANNIGLDNFQINVSDVYDEPAQADITIVTFDNLKPVALFDVELRNIISPYEYNFFCADSYDKDQRFGGNIERYRLIIDGNIVKESANSTLTHIFNGAGTYTVAIQVKDNSGEWSPVNEISYIVN